MVRSLFSMLIILLGLNYYVYGQDVSVGAIVSAQIVEPLNLNNVRDMDFGNIIAGATSGTVILDPNASSTRSATGGVTFPSGSSTVQSAKFIVSGTKDHIFTIILPSSVTLSNGSQSMVADNFKSVPSGSGVLISGSQTVYVGATLNINALQTPGTYHSTENFVVTVNYD